MKYKFEVKVALTYKDKDIEVEVELSDKEVTRIKELVAASVSTDDGPIDEDEYVPEKSLLSILEENDSDLFNKFWNTIMPPVFIEILINGITNYGSEIKKENDDFIDYLKANFDDLYVMYGDDIEIEHSCCCNCKIPKTWIPT